MSEETLSFSEYSNVLTQMSNTLASGWSEAASSFAARVAQEGGEHVVSQTRQFDLFAAELGDRFRNAANAAQDWAQAARASNNEAVARIYDRYAERYFGTANTLLDTLIDKKSALDALAREAAAGARAAENALGGSFGRALGPAFDAAAMTKGALDWANTGDSDEFGAAAMGVALGGGFGIAVAGIGALFAMPAIIIAAVAGVAAIFGSSLGKTMYDAFKDSVNRFFLLARIPEPPRVDPLVLDLDGDGIETVGIQPGAAVLFDHNADGIKPGSGWVKADDGILVLDLDGNGQIETGRELFGDQTLVQSGANAGQRAANGLAALAQHDTNADSRIDSADAIYGQLQVWQDLNQDGISQSGELHSLSQLGIASLQVSGTPSNTALQDATTGMASGNTLQTSGSFTRVDGSVGVSGDLLLASNNFYREFTVEPQAAARRHRRLERICHGLRAKTGMSPRKKTIVCYQNMRTQGRLNAAMHGKRVSWRRPACTAMHCVDAQGGQKSRGGSLQVGFANADLAFEV